MAGAVPPVPPVPPAPVPLVAPLNAPTLFVPPFQPPGTESLAGLGRYRIFTDALTSLNNQQPTSLCTPTDVGTAELATARVAMNLAGPSVHLNATIAAIALPTVRAQVAAGLLGVFNEVQKTHNRYSFNMGPPQTLRALGIPGLAGAPPVYPPAGNFPADTEEFLSWRGTMGIGVMAANNTRIDTLLSFMGLWTLILGLRSLQ